MNAVQDIRSRVAAVGLQPSVQYSMLGYFNVPGFSVCLRWLLGGDQRPASKAVVGRRQVVLSFPPSQRGVKLFQQTVIGVVESPAVGAEVFVDLGGALGPK